MERIYVLVDVERAKFDGVIASLRGVPEVVRVDAVTGEHDVVVTAEGEDLPKLLGGVIRRLREVEGVKATETLVVFGATHQVGKG
jgi:DNA-binding Lrp family transcriptional regulator